MNKIYKTIWNESVRAWIAVHENAAACGKPARRARLPVSRGLLALGVAATGFALAVPGASAQTVVSGGANNAPSGMTASVDQNCGQNFVDRQNPGNPSSGGGTYVLTNGCSTAVGNNASAQTAGVAVGDRANAAQGGVALGVGATAVQGNSGVAIGTVALSSGNTSIAVGRQSAATGDYSMALGNVAYAKGESGIAMGHSALADGYRSIAIGASDSRAAGNDGVSSGASYNPATQTRASGTNSVSLGAGAVTSIDDSVALGSNSIGAANAAGPAKFSGDAIASTGAVSVGSAGSERQIKNVAGGTAATDAVNVNQLTAVSDRAVKYDTNADGSINYGSVTLNPGGSPSKLGNVAAGDVSAASTDAVNGSQLNDTNQNVTKLGDTLNHIAGDTSQSYTDRNGTGIRYARTNEAGLAQTDAFAQAPGSTAVGYAATASADDALALGRQATASHAGSVALGANAVADGSTLGNAAYNAGTGTLAGTNPVGEVSIGGSGAERRITNVAAGSGDTDAVNVSQLKSLQASVGDLSAGAVKYDRNPDGTIDYTHVTMNPGGAPATITNVAAGELSATSTDAVNGSQLYETNQNVTRLGDQVDNIANGGGIKYFHANGGAAPLPDAQANGAGSAAMGPAANANGVNSVAVGNGAVANKDGDVALGAGSAADRGAEQYTGKYSGAQNSTAGTVSVGAPGAERTVSNVADGREATDAVNVRQLDGAVEAAKDYTDQQVQKVAGDVVNVGDDVRKLGDRMTNVEGDVTSVKNGSGGMFQVSQDRTPVAPAASGSNAVAGGAGAVASGANSTALGNQASATGSNSTAVGNGAKASGSNSVALGAGSDGSRDNAVSMGAAGRERQIVNVAPGTAGTDAVNVNQLRAMEHGLGSQIAGVRSDLQGLDHRLTAGVAAAMAMAGLPQAYLPGKSMVALGGGAWRGESGVALGLSTVSDNGNWVLKGSASSTSRGDLGASVGVGYQW
ncbi:MAG: YadA-like family protein [Burkholderia sp.]|jgi:autotransporter adhesin|uniref:YadA-like family protein n=1 Tax=Burkholderia sp. TaxID=36773 RepID=UPI00283A6D9E|nr:YadA-like family protein [Burkholderia sp.]MDR0246461.1 YadA-like family protein [Burkholderia sp.]